MLMAIRRQYHVIMRNYPKDTVERVVEADQVNVLAGFIVFLVERPLAVPGADGSAQVEREPVLIVSDRSLVLVEEV